MARQKLVMPMSASVDFIWHSIGEMPWAKIEDAAGKCFSTDEREEIYRCVDYYCYEYHWIKQAPGKSDVDNLKAELIRHAEAICDLAREIQPLQRATDDASVQKRAFEALSILHAHEDFNLRSALHKAARSAQKLSWGLSFETELDKETYTHGPEIAGLMAFLARVLEFADATPARSKSTSGDAGAAKEFSRWGIPVGPKCKTFPAFVSVVLGKTVTENQIRTAWPKALETYRNQWAGILPKADL
ncbi:hypothetical protein CDZ97_08755 [Mameliella alba]|uniref:hypothetical protein n=1 Tax=Mameliella alba TaxID=561184 RepID=UPI000B52D785|nr:hypothetical protein [Mameliella alba]OWV64956.1 hypothetical protein CDZ97_08755 [Mameliella alba]